MGVQITPFTVSVQQLSQDWNNIRRSLRAEDQKYFDQFFQIVNRNIQAGNLQNHPYPMEMACFLVILELLKKIDSISKNPELFANEI